MANFDLGSGPVLGTGVLDGTPSAGPAVSGLVLGFGDGINNVRGRVVAGVLSPGTVAGTGAVSGYVVPSLRGAVSGAQALSGSARGTALLPGSALGAGTVLGAFATDAVVPGLVPGTGVLTGDVYRSFRGEADGAGSVAGAFGVAAVVAGLVAGAGAVSGALVGSSSVSGLVSGAQSVTGAVRGGPAVRGAVAGTQALSAVLRLAATVTARLVVATAEVTGSLVREQPAIGSAEGEYEASGVRRGLPLLVYELAALGPADLAAVPDGGSFLVAASYAGSAGDPFFEAGAAPSAVGTVVKPVVGSAYLVFRQPLADEVVWHVPSETTYRYRRDRDTGLSTWGRYRSMPQRAAEGMYVFSIFDPDGIYLYYLKALGAVQYKLGYDNQVLLDQFDPDRVSHFYIASLAANYGLELDDTDTLPVKRAKTRNAVSVAKFKGLDEGVRLRIRSLGLTGYANEIWVNPTDPSNFQSTVVNPDSTPTSTPTGAGTVWREYPHGYRSDDPTDGFFPSSRLAVHLNDGSGRPLVITAALKEQVARELGRDVLPAHVDIRWFATDVPVADAEGVSVSDSLVIT